MLLEVISGGIGSGGLIIGIQAILKYKNQAANRKAKGEFTEKETVELIKEQYQNQLKEQSGWMKKMMDDMDEMKKQLFELRIENKGLKQQNLTLLDKVKVLEKLTREH